jgi:hypothetical protein
MLSRAAGSLAFDVAQSKRLRRGRKIACALLFVRQQLLKGDEHGLLAHTAHRRVLQQRREAASPHGPVEEGGEP